MTGTVVGREQELATLSRLLDPADPTRQAVLTGSPGVGKTTLVDLVVGRAEAVGHLVLTARPRRTEQALAFNVLADLLGALLPTGRSDEHETVLRAALTASGGHRAVDPRLVAVAVREVLVTASRERPVLVVVDDAHWVDDASLLVLPHAVRRLAGVPVSLLVATRPTDRDDPWPTGPQRLDLALDGLSPAALFHLVRDRLGVTLGRGDLGRLERASGGNPMYALELARAWADGDADDAVLTPTLEQLVRQHIRQLPAPVRRLLLVAALAHDPTPAVLAAATGMSAAAVDDSLRAGAAVAAVARGRVRFDHPLHAAAVVADAGADQRRDAHRRLAAVEPDTEMAARHRALADDGPDPATAALLTRAALGARARGAHAAARDLAFMAVAATPPGDNGDAARRLLLGGWALHDGDPQTCADVVGPVAARDGREAHAAHLLLARRALAADRAVVARAHATRALDSPDPLVRSSARLVLAEVEEDIVAGRESAVVALGDLEAVGPDVDPAEAGRLRVAALTAVGQHDLLLRRPEGMDRLALAVRLEERYPPDEALAGARFAFAQQLLFASRLGEARTLLTSLLEDAHALGDESSEPALLLNLGHLEVRAGRLAEAGRLARAGLAQAELAGQAGAVALGRLQVAGDDALTGADSAAEMAVAAAAMAADTVGDPWLAAIVRAVHGRIRLARGDVEGALIPLRELGGLAERAGLRDTGWNPSPGDLAEALAVTGDLDAAEAELERLLEGVEGLDRPHVHAVVPRVRALVRTERIGADLESLELALASVREHERLDLRFELGRSLLVAGVLHRRARQKAAAHRLLARAVEVLEACPAPRWAARAAAELARVGLRPAAPGALTETEQRVARLAVAGRTNKEIAAEAFLSPKTVEAVLGRVYRKLGVRSRVELVSALPEPDEDPAPH